MKNTYDDSLVSVVIPVYNSEKYILDTVNSAIQQTYKKIEIIIIDDCSTDNTKGVVLNKFPKNNIRYFVQEKNKGAAEARNRGLKEAKGRYIAFLDSDDLWEKNKIEKQLQCLNDTGYGFCYTAYDLINDEKQVIKECCKVKKITNYNDVLTKTLICTPSVMIDRNIIGNKEFPLRRTGQDYAFWLLILRDTNAIALEDCLTHVKKRKNSLSKNKFQNIKDIWEVQTKNEKIPKFITAINVFRYCIYIAKKRIM